MLLADEDVGDGALAGDFLESVLEFTAVLFSRMLAMQGGKVVFADLPILSSSRTRASMSKLRRVNFARAQ